MQHCAHGEASFAWATASMSRSCRRSSFQACAYDFFCAAGGYQGKGRPSSRRRRSCLARAHADGRRALRHWQG
eukprot:2183546-Prymnesium_polylepis.1